MPYKFDPELEVVLRPILEMKENMPPLPVHDIASRRTMNEGAIAMFNGSMPVIESVVRKTFQTKTSDGYDLGMDWFSKSSEAGAEAGPAILFVHGGGFILSNMSHYTNIIAELVDRSGIPVLAMDFRNAPEHPHPTPVEDCFAALTWLRDSAATMSPPVDPARIGVYGGK